MFLLIVIDPENGSVECAMDYDHMNRERLVRSALDWEYLTGWAAWVEAV